MKQPRPASISDSLPFYNEWAHVHPARGWKNPKDAYLFPSKENKAMYRNVPLKVDSLRLCYVKTLEEHFPKFLNSPNVSPEEKLMLHSLIYDKPHYPYVRRHEFASEWAPRTSRLVFNQLMGHSPMSKMQDVYVHALGNEGVRELEIAKGIRTREETLSPAQLELQPKYCPICKEPNRHNSKFCFKCDFIISKEGWLEDREKEAETLKEKENMKKELEELKTRRQVDMEQITAQLANTQDQVGAMLQMLSNIKKFGAKSGTDAETDFVLRKLGQLTEGKIGEDPDTGVTVEPV
jgi:hypothetical protein